MNKTILITGASSGIGKSTALYFREKGWHVAATMRHPEMVPELQDLSGLRCFRLDVGDTDSIQEAVRHTIEEFGRLDVVVNNAAYNVTGAFEGATSEQIRDLYDVNVFGLMNVTREVLPWFRQAGKGMLINISSLGGRIGMPQSSLYASAKWAVEGYSESLRFEMEKLGVTVKIVEPGAIDTNFSSNTIVVRKSDVSSYEETIEKRIAAYEKRRDRLSDPIVVAKVIFQAATDRKGRLRYLAGGDAKLFWRMHQILPFSVFTSLIRKMAG